jgi:DUF971 family protein
VKEPVAITPARIKLAGGDEALVVEWSDGHVSVYPYHYLRQKCPCATCGASASLPEPAANPFPLLGQKPLRPERAELVGRYALQIFWNDGHSAGIYSFDYLRDLCPCEVCAARRG